MNRKREVIRGSVVRSRHLIVGTAAMVLLGLNGCGDSTPDFTVNAVDIRSVPDANENWPIAIDLVYVRAVPLIDEILKLTAAEWFQKKQQILRDHPKSIEVHGWELVPDQIITEHLTNDAAWAVIAFANYASAGPHRLRLSEPGEAKIRLGLNEFSATP